MISPLFQGDDGRSRRKGRNKTRCASAQMSAQSIGLGGDIDWLPISDSSDWTGPSAIRIIRSTRVRVCASMKKCATADGHTISRTRWHDPTDWFGFSSSIEAVHVVWYPDSTEVCSEEAFATRS